MSNEFFKTNLLPLISYSIYEKLGQYTLILAHQQDYDISESQMIKENTAQY